MGLAAVLTGCPFAMSDDYVVQSDDPQSTPPAVDAGALPPDAPADAPGCVPATCEQLDAECGTALDGCGGTLDCGTCEKGHPCGTRKPNRCDKEGEG